MFEKMKRAAKRFVERHLDEHLTLGPLTLYGAGAMDWAVNLRVPALGATLCAKPPTARSGWYFYASPNSTPWAAVLGCGPGLDRDDGERVAQRLEVVEQSPRPVMEAEKLWALWGPKPVMAQGGGEGNGSRDVFNPNTGLFETVAAPKPLRRFTVLGADLVFGDA